MKFSSYSENSFKEAIEKLKDETDFKKFNLRLKYLRQWLQWLNDKKKIENSDYVKFQHSLITLENERKGDESKSYEREVIVSNRKLSLKGIGFIILILISCLNIYLLVKNSSYFNNTYIEESQGRVLPFKGTLEQTSGEPLDTKRDVTFRLYETSEGGNALYTGSCLGQDGIRPQFNGTFSILIGADCNMTPIPESLFKENDTLYLGVTIGSGVELKPRYQIFTTSFSRDTSKFQGLKVGGSSSSIPFIDDKGYLNLEGETPTIQATDGTLNLQGNILSIKSTEPVNGHIILHPADQANVIIENGRLGIGDFTPNHLLSVESSQPFSTIGSLKNLSVQDDPKTSVLRLSLGTSTEGENSSFIEFYANADDNTEGTKVGNIRINNEGVVYETGGADFAEYFNITNKTDIQIGSIISISNEGLHAARQGEKIIGAVSDSAGFIGNLKESPNGVLLALVGQIEVVVSNVNGDIKVGDRIGASTIPGVGSKVSRDDYSVGYALESSDSSFTNEKCQQKYRKVRDPQGKRVKCGTVKVLVDSD